MNHIRNFSIIAHIDHGKSTLADRLIQRCGGLAERDMEAQVLDSMDIEKERGITIKAQTAALQYKAKDGKTYNLNLIDTPGHVDFSYEVSRSLSACEGALLVVDASQGVEAQTVANCYTALDLGVEVLPVLNKMDLPQADPDNAKAEIEDVIGIDATDAVPCSAKTGMGVDEILEMIVAKVPAPRGNPDAPLRAMIIDSWFDSYVGVVMLVRVVDGRLAKNERIKLMATGACYEAGNLGVFTPANQPRDSLEAGEVGYIIAGIKELKAAIKSLALGTLEEEIGMDEVAHLLGKTPPTALLGLPHQQLLDTVYGGDVETVTGADGKPVVVSRRDAIGKPAYIKPDAGAKPTLGVAEYPDGRSVPAQVGSDGVWRNTQTGEALPLGFTVFDLPKATGSKSDVGMAGLTTSAASEAQRKAMTIDTAIASGKDLLKQLGDTPGSLGIAGWSRRTIQDLVQTGNELAQAYQGQIADTIARAEKAGTDAGLLSEKFDPKLPAIQAAMNMFIWNMAAANSGDRVSNEQFNRLQQALGLDGAFANTASASAKIAEAIRLMEQQRGYLDETLNAGTVQPPGATGGPKPGEVIDGYRFKGGDPSVPANWEQVK